jgi:hypothetical protein
MQSLVFLWRVSWFIGWCAQNVRLVNLDNVIIIIIIIIIMRTHTEKILLVC